MKQFKITIPDKQLKILDMLSERSGQSIEKILEISFALWLKANNK